MTAKISTSGNIANGITIELTLPVAWLEQFHPSMGVEVARDLLSRTWGKPNGDDRFVALEHLGSAEVLLELGDLLKAIDRAKEALGPIEIVEIEVEL